MRTSSLKLIFVLGLVLTVVWVPSWNVTIVQAATSNSTVNSDVKIKITIEKVKALDCPDEWLFGCGNADFFPYWYLEGLSPRDEDSYIPIEDDNEIEPGWVTPHPEDGDPSFDMSLGSAGVVLHLLIIDDDNGLTWVDDEIDISPGGTRDLVAKIRWDKENFSEASFTVYSKTEEGSWETEVFPLKPVFPAGFATVDSKDAEGKPLVFSGESSDRAEITLSVEVIPVPKSTAPSKVRPIGIHSPIHPDPTDNLTISAGVTDEFGESVDVDSIEIWVDPNPHDGNTEDRIQLTTTSTCPQAPPASVKTSCVVGNFDLNSIIENPPGLGNDEQRMFSYIVGVIDSDHASEGVWSGWRSLTVGNRTNAEQIAFSVGSSNPRKAIDFQYAGHAPHYGAAGCGGKAVPIYGTGGLVELAPPSSPRAVYRCETPIDKIKFADAVERNWSNSFASHRYWEPAEPERWSDAGYEDSDQNYKGFDLSDVAGTNHSMLGPDSGSPGVDTKGDSTLVTMRGSRFRSTGQGYADLRFSEKDNTMYHPKYDQKFRLVGNPADYRVFHHDTGTVINDLVVTDVINSPGNYPIVEVTATANIPSTVWPVDIIGPAIQSGGYLDVLRTNHQHLNFWYTTAPAIGSDDWGWFDTGEGGATSTAQLGPSFIDYHPDWVPERAKNVRKSGFHDTTIILFNDETWRAAAAVSDPTVAVHQNHFKTTLHEIGHRPFGLADTYGRDGGAYQSYPFINLYRKSDWYIYGDVIDVVDDVVDVVVSIFTLDFEASDYRGCEQDPFLPPDHAGMPVPESWSPSITDITDAQGELVYKGVLGEGLTEDDTDCRAVETFWESMSLGDWWFSPEPYESLMGSEQSMLPSPAGLPGVKVRTQGAPQTTHQIMWYIGRCINGGLKGHLITGDC